MPLWRMPLAWLSLWVKLFFLAKTDVKNAFRLIPIRPEDYDLLGIHWQGLYYYDRCMPMGGSSSCRTFEVFSTALEWIGQNKLHIPCILHLLDDFLIVFPSEDSSQHQWHTFLMLCSYLGVPMAPEIADFQKTGTGLHESSSHRDPSSSPASQLASVTSYLLRSSLQPSSIPTYRRAWKLFYKFYNAVFQLPFAFLPISPSLLALFIAYLFDFHYAPSTVTTYISALGYSHKLLGFPDPSKVFYVSQILKGYKKVGFRLDSRLPITLPILERLVSMAPFLQGSTYQMSQFRAMCLLAFYAFLRIGEMTATFNGNANPPLQLCGLDPSRYKGQSFRIGAASYAADWGFFWYSDKNVRALEVQRFSAVPSLSSWTNNWSNHNYGQGGSVCMGGCPTLLYLNFSCYQGFI